MKHIKAAAKVSRAAKLKALSDSAGVVPGASSTTAGASSSRARQPSLMPQQMPMAGAGMTSGGSGSAPMVPMQAKRGGSVKAKRGIGGRLMDGMQGMPGMGGKKDEEQRARGGAVKMSAGAGTGDGRLQKTAAAKRAK